MVRHFTGDVLRGTDEKKAGRNRPFLSHKRIALLYVLADEAGHLEH
ncbi:MAG: hypothetical protein JWP47_696 [Polaromonas sp.]|nr:hypothetical protein [Polaromonas sp.]